MPTKLQLSFVADAPKGDVITICLIGKGGQIVPSLDQDVAAYLIDAMAANLLVLLAKPCLPIITDKLPAVGIGPCWTLVRLLKIWAASCFQLLQKPRQNVVGCLTISLTSCAG